VIDATPLAGPTLLSLPAVSLQAADQRGRSVWTVAYHIPHRDVTAAAEFVVLSTANGTALTLTRSHMVYVANAAGSGRVPAAADDVQACLASARLWIAVW